MKFEREYTTRTCEINTHGYLKPTQLFQYLQETAEHQLKYIGRDYTYMYNVERKAFLLSRMGVEIYEPVYRYADITVRTWVIEGRAANFPRAYEMYSGDKLIAKSYSNWALVDVDTRKLIRSKDYDYSEYPHDEIPEMVLPSRVRIPSDLELKAYGTARVGYNLSDINGHMNNTQYLNILADEIPGVEDYDFTSINIRYINEAPLGSEMEITGTDIVWKTDNPGLAAETDPAADGVIFFRTTDGGVINVEAAFGIKKVEQL